MYLPRTQAMTKIRTNPETTPEDNDKATSEGNSLSMHADVPVWYDCCSCEAEPYWTEAFGEPDENASKD